MVKAIKTAIESAKPATFDDLEKSIDNLLLQYRNAVHTTTKHSPAMLFKQRNLRSSLHCIDISDVIFYKGNDYRPSNAIVLRALGDKLVQLLDTTYGSLHQRHLDQIRFRGESTTDLDKETADVIDEVSTGKQVSNQHSVVETGTDAVADKCKKVESAEVEPQQCRRSTRVRKPTDFYRP